MDEILRDVVGSALREQRYEPGPCREAAKDIAEVGRGRGICPRASLGCPKYPLKIQRKRKAGVAQGGVQIYRS